MCTKKGAGGCGKPTATGPGTYTKELLMSDFLPTCHVATSNTLRFDRKKGCWQQGMDEVREALHGGGVWCTNLCF